MPPARPVWVTDLSHSAALLAVAAGRELLVQRPGLDVGVGRAGQHLGGDLRQPLGRPERRRVLVLAGRAVALVGPTARPASCPSCAGVQSLPGTQRSAVANSTRAEAAGRCRPEAVLALPSACRRGRRRPRSSCRCPGRRSWSRRRSCTGSCCRAGRRRCPGSSATPGCTSEASKVAPWQGSPASLPNTGTVQRGLRVRPRLAEVVLRAVDGGDAPVLAVVVAVGRSGQALDAGAVVGLVAPGAGLVVADQLAAPAAEETMALSLRQHRSPILTGVVRESSAHGRSCAR